MERDEETEKRGQQRKERRESSRYSSSMIYIEAQNIYIYVLPKEGVYTRFLDNEFLFEFYRIF